ncbi:MAG: glycine cleavage system aminomethyltransferase GcvT [Candidatus Dormibacteraeota bacterium]|nr:glycine cleavage system aminomethyltransferase GcvT [Candidatus Dormibacteraeota bacterium]
MVRTTLGHRMAARTPLYARHAALGARIVEFAGYDMPLQYTSIRDEHLAVRQRAGLFDVSHMGEVLVEGDGAAEWVQRLVTNDVSRLAPRQALYSVMCNERGGIIDDLIVARTGEASKYLIVVNAATRAKDVAWMHERASAGLAVEDVSDDIALLAVQGPRAIEALQPITELESGDPLSSLAPFHTAPCRIAGISGTRQQHVSRTGYTGEDGVEIYIDADRAAELWDALLEAGKGFGMVPCGLGARDTLRLEAGLRLYGQDMDENTDPYSCALGWTVKRAKGDFVGAAALAELDPKNPPRRFIGLRLPGHAIARHGHAVTDGKRVVGEVTSGTFSFTLGYGIATASVQEGVDSSTPLFVDIRGTEVAAEHAALPFYRRPKGE